MNNYLIPANSKRSMLIFNMFRPIDLIIFAVGACTTLVLLFVISSFTITALIIKLFPILVTSFLIIPLPNYHNVMVFIREMFIFITSKRIYLWKGWCVRNESTEK